jgi:hypothetical protein
LKLQSKKDKDLRSGAEGKKEAADANSKEKPPPLGGLNLQDSVENSFREKLVIQVNYLFI